ncbi:MAG TPA: tetratricopeptide repeat protein [Candidatus Saccharimonadales bacterium]|nr:tetratricopeptide repeat protein [Candidatus Saccharimonadales bacterium]
MLELILVVVFGFLAYRAINIQDDELSEIPRRISDKLGKLWDIAHHGMRENRLLRAEKALLTILKIDQKNAAAYNRLGILYAKQKEYKDAIDCFEIASSIEPTASSLHNLGLIYYETENYNKSATAFEQALKLEDDLAARHIAYAKVQEKLGNHKLMVHELERAVELEPNNESYTLLIKTYEDLDMQAEADITKEKLKKLILPSHKPKRLVRAKRVVI